MVCVGPGPTLTVARIAIMTSTTSPEEAAFSGLLWLGGILLLIVTAVAVAIYMRRGIRSSGQDGEPPFTLEDLRRMRDAGEVTQTEFDALKRRIIDGFLNPASRDR